MSNNAQNILPIASLAILVSCWGISRGQDGLICLLICLVAGICLGRCVHGKNEISHELLTFSRTGAVVLYLSSALLLGLGNRNDSLNLALGGSIFFNIFLLLGFEEQRKFMGSLMQSLPGRPRFSRQVLTRKV